MGVAGVAFALFTTGYILGVWVACAVLRQPQSVYEDGLPMPLAAARAIVARAVGTARQV
jgi:hypothetical protein